MKKYMAVLAVLLASCLNFAWAAGPLHNPVQASLERKIQQETLSGPDQLLWAVYNNNYRKVVHLIKVKKVNVNAPNSYTMTPLGLACALGNKNIVVYLIDHTHHPHKVNLNAKDRMGKVPLQYAAEYAVSTGDGDIFEILVDAGAKTNIQDPKVEYMLQWLKEEKYFFHMYQQHIRFSHPDIGIES